MSIVWQEEAKPLRDPRPRPTHSIVVGDGMSVFASGYDAPFLVDAEVGKRVRTMADYLDVLSTNILNNSGRGDQGPSGIFPVYMAVGDRKHAPGRSK